jgi:hypothetical protein
MGSRQYKPPVTSLGRFVRARRPDRNPLRRACDRAETAVLAVLVIAFVVGVPFAVLGASSWAHAAAHRTQLAERAAWTPVTAVTLTTAPDEGTANGLDAQVPARWTAPDGARATGEVPVAPGSKAGMSVQVWTTRDGQLAGPPLLDSQVSGDTILGGIGGGMVVAVALTLTWALARRLLDEHRMAAWDAEWQSTEPRWTTRA